MAPSSPNDRGQEGEGGVAGVPDPGDPLVGRGLLLGLSGRPGYRRARAIGISPPLLPSAPLLPPPPPRATARATSTDESISVADRIEIQGGAGGGGNYRPSPRASAAVADVPGVQCTSFFSGRTGGWRGGYGRGGGNRVSFFVRNCS